MTPDPLILTVAPNGAYKQHSDHPAVPLTPQALADTARRCLDAGAAMLHLHIRDAEAATAWTSRATARPCAWCARPWATRWCCR